MTAEAGAVAQQVATQLLLSFVVVSRCCRNGLVQHPQVTLQSVLLAAELLRVRCRHSGKLLRLPNASLATVGTPTPAVLTAIYVD